MKIDKVKIYLVSIPLPKPFYPVWIPGYPQMHNNFYLIEITTDTGIAGYSTTFRFANEGRGIFELLPIFLKGRNPLDINGILRIFNSASYIGFRLHWIEPALWDIKGKSEGISLYKMFGGKEDRVLAYASTGELHTPEKRVEEVLQLKEMGFKCVKLRTHSEDINDDIKTVKAVREAIGESMNIMVDANQAWRIEIFKKIKQWSLEDAIYFAEAMSDLQVVWIEEPLDMHDYEGLAKLREKSKVPIAGGEMNFGLHEFKEFIFHRSLDILQPDATLSGGISLSRNVVLLAEKYGLQFTPHTWTNGIGLLINLAILGNYSGDKILEYPIEPPGWIPEVRDGILQNPVTIDKEGYIGVPAEAGIGISIDEEKLKRYGQVIFET